MGELSKRAAKYYFVQGTKQALFVLAFLAMITVLNCLVFVDGSVMDSLMDNIGSSIRYGSYMIVLCNFMFSVYGPNWYDSIALSLGCRRKDIFIGEMIKQVMFVLSDFIVLIALATVAKQEYIIVLIGFVVLGLVMGPLGLIVGHKIKRIGRIVVLVTIMVGAFFSAMLSNIIAMRTEAFITEGCPVTGVVIGFIIVAAVLYTLFEFWAYNLNKKSMVV
ncbi:hypothetical protein [Butyrivibrio sp. INlla21]|uniref:hypothetical protein n=1 Tax=Butyrivibrio sp. INlla21 TaxID=1520811 RepID=UPI0008E23453|nr:hypothetical protein [Butyrivibrio sp. INlla21]SFU89915.1 hypothetical protein SAMN02910342_02288 [Butyrivibrio sp. INlla21]